MKYNCPHCGQPVKRKYNRTAQAVGGLAGVLLMSAIGPFECAKCGQIKQNEFPEETRSKIKLANSLRVILAIALILAVFWLILAVN